MSTTFDPPDYERPAWQDDPYAARLDLQFELPRLRGVGDLLYGAFHLYGDHFQTILMITLVLVVPFDALISLCDTLSNGHDGLHLLSGLFNLGQIVSVSFATPAVIYVMLIGLREYRQVGWQEAIGWGGKAGWRTLGYRIVCGLIILLGLVLLIVPGVIFAVWLWLVDVVVAVEGRGHPNVLGRSKALIKGNGWRVLAAGLLLSLGMWIAVVIWSVLVELMFGGHNSLSSQQIVVLFLAELIMNVGLSLLVWLFTATAVVVYMDGVGTHLRECSDCGYDLTGNVSGHCPECGKPIPPHVQALLEPVEPHLPPTHP